MITQDQLKEHLHYNPENGIFTWIKVNTYTRKVKVGDMAGSKNDQGYIKIMILCKHYSAHRLAFLYVNGKLPSESVDHINGIKSDNRIINLRVVTLQENLKNKSKYKCNKSGFIGVGWHKRDRAWVASIRVDKKLIHLGNFKKLSCAVKSRIEAEERYGFHINHGR